jgi:hypothetical protein
LPLESGVGYGAKTVAQLATSPDYTVVATSLPLLIGFNPGSWHQIVVAP